MNIQYPIWKTLDLGPDYDELVKSVNDSVFMQNQGLKIDISENARNALRAPAFSLLPRHTRVNLIGVSFSTLGFKGKVPLEQIFLRAQELGFIKCPPETGPKLRLEYLNQPKGLRLVVGMEPVSFGGYRDMFTLDREGQTLWLRAVCGNSTVLWDDEFEWIFALPNK